MFGAGGAQRFEFLGMGGSHVVQCLFRLRTDGVPFGCGCFGQSERGVTPALDLREFRKHSGKSSVLVIQLSANGTKFVLKFCMGGLECPGARDGGGRARGGRIQIAADCDVEAVRLWLAEYAGSPHTLRSYRKDAVRLLHWATRTLGKPLSSLTREDFLLYERFLAASTGDWADPVRPRRGGTRWLFDGPLSTRSQHQPTCLSPGNSLRQPNGC